MVDGVVVASVVVVTGVVVTGVVVTGVVVVAGVVLVSLQKQQFSSPSGETSSNPVGHIFRQTLPQLIFPSTHLHSWHTPLPQRLPGL